jgi:hypothetical protein
MAYERRGKKSYYYSKERIGERVVSTYYGAGKVGEITAAADRIVRNRRKLDKRRRRE